MFKRLKTWLAVWAERYQQREIERLSLLIIPPSFAGKELRRLERLGSYTGIMDFSN